MGMEEHANGKLFGPVSIKQKKYIIRRPGILDTSAGGGRAIQVTPQLGECFRESSAVNPLYRKDSPPSSTAEPVASGKPPERARSSSTRHRNVPSPIRRRRQSPPFPVLGPAFLRDWRCEKALPAPN